MSDTSWGPNEDFLAEQPSLTDAGGDPAGNLGEQVGVREDYIDAGLARTADPTSDKTPQAEYGRQVQASSPVYERARNFGNPAFACVFCKHFERVHGEALTNDPKFMQFITHEMKFVAPDALAGNGEGPVHKHWFDTDMLGRCAMRDDLVTSAMANCAMKPSQFKRKAMRNILGDLGNKALERGMARLFSGLKR